MKAISQPKAETKLLRLLCFGSVAGALNFGLGGILTLGLLRLLEGQWKDGGSGEPWSILLAGGSLGLIVAPAFLQLRQRLEGSAVRRGAVFGLCLLALALIAATPLALSQASETILWHFTPALIVLGSACAGYGLMLAIAVEEFDRFTDSAPRERPCVVSKSRLVSPRWCASGPLPISKN